jgi:hypothetical protein
MSSEPIPPPYADFIGILSPPNSDPPIRRARHSSPPKTRLHLICELFTKCLHVSIKYILIVILLLFSTYQIALACYKCPLNGIDLNWIWASLFMNIPFALGVFSFVVFKLIHHKLPSYLNIAWIAVAYLYVPAWHLVIDWFIITGMEMNNIRVTLQNKTGVTLLSCSERHYRHLFGFMIAQCVYPVFCLFLFCVLFSCLDKSTSFSDERIRRWDQCISGILYRWRRCKTILCKRHVEGFV